MLVPKSAIAAVPSKPDALVPKACACALVKLLNAMSDNDPKPSEDK